MFFCNMYCSSHWVGRRGIWVSLMWDEEDLNWGGLSFVKVFGKLVLWVIKQQAF